MSLRPTPGCDDNDFIDVMPGLVPGIHALAAKRGVDGRDIGE
jgi:hypothetical protein